MINMLIVEDFISISCFIDVDEQIIKFSGKFEFFFFGDFKHWNKQKPETAFKSLKIFNEFLKLIWVLQAFNMKFKATFIPAILIELSSHDEC